MEFDFALKHTMSSKLPEPSVDLLYQGFPMCPKNTVATYAILNHTRYHEVCKFLGQLCRCFACHHLSKHLSSLICRIKASMVEIYFNSKLLLFFFLYTKLPITRLALKSINSPPPGSLTHCSPKLWHTTLRSGIDQDTQAFFLGPLELISACVPLLRTGRGCFRGGEPSGCECS
jgi:hypothetical protein